MKTNTVELFYIGDDFYPRSNTIMSNIYEAGTNCRYDWGYVQRDLRAGKEIHIRQATKDEMLVARKMLQTSNG